LENFPPNKYSEKTGHQSNSSQDSIYEQGTVIHDGEQCRKVLQCKICTPKYIVEELEERRKQWFLEHHKGKNVRARARQKQAKAKATKITAIEQHQQPERDDWDPTIDLEDAGN
jgi:hypothetical protein